MFEEGLEISVVYFTVFLIHLSQLYHRFFNSSSFASSTEEVEGDLQA